MGSYRVVFRGTAEDELRSVPFPFRRQLVHAIERLKKSPRPAASETLGASYRLLVHGWWLLYGIDEDQALITLHAIVLRGAG